MPKARIIAGWLVWWVLGGSPSRAGEDGTLSEYLYQDTKDLVRLVESAAAQVETKGEAAFEEFAVQGSRWFPDETHYLFIYDDTGVCAFHPVNSDLVGKDQSGLKDFHGQPIVANIAAIGKRPEKDASDWVFYMWEEGLQFAPRWKSAYIRKAITPKGRVLLVGYGSYGIKPERVFIKNRVDLAVDLLQKEGPDKVFPLLRNSASPFQFLDSFVFVVDQNGRGLVDPSYPTLTGRDLTKFKDAIGKPVTTEILNKLTRSDQVWVQYLWPKPNAVVPSRKLVYARKVVINGQTLIVGADMFLYSPIWMKM